MTEVRVLTGAALDAALEDVARLRIAVFRDFPYLYDGDLEYERGYLQTYRDSPGAVLVGAFDGARLMGAATGTPMEDHAEDFAQAFAGTGLPLAEIFYCAESVLLPEARGQGIGHRFFDLREAHARTLGLNPTALRALFFTLLAACTVAALQTVGAFLVIALVVTPGATAYLLCDRFPRLLALAVGIGASTCALGAYLSYFLDGATGGVIVCLQTALFLLALAFAPKHGVLAARRRARVAASEDAA